MTEMTRAAPKRRRAWSSGNVRLVAAAAPRGWWGRAFVSLESSRHRRVVVLHELDVGILHALAAAFCRRGSRTFERADSRVCLLVLSLGHDLNLLFEGGMVEHFTSA